MGRIRPRAGLSIRGVGICGIRFPKNLSKPPKRSPLVDEGHVGDSGTGQREEAAGSATSSQPLSINDLNRISRHGHEHL